MIATGDIAIRQGTVLPQQLSLDSDSFSPGWTSLGNNVGIKNLETALVAGGWTRFCLAGSGSRGKAFGFDTQKTTRAAARRLFAGPNLNGANCVEIDEIAHRSFLGIPWIVVTGHGSHIQTGTSPLMRSFKRKAQ